MLFRAPKVDKDSEPYRHGVAAAKMLASPEETDARIAYLKEQIADPGITETERRLSLQEWEILTRARDAVRREEECAERRRQHDVMWAAFSRG